MPNMTFDLPQSELTLIAELDRAAALLARTRTLLAQFPTESLADYERAQQMPSYRALRRDEREFQALWLRLHSRILQLHKHDHRQVQTDLRRIDSERSAALRDLELDLRERQHEARERRAAANPPVRQVIGSAPGRNEPCPCGSQLKYKRCCGDPLRHKPLAA